jgi:hypothetical protein
MNGHTPHESAQPPPCSIFVHPRYPTNCSRVRPQSLRMARSCPGRRRSTSGTTTTRTPCLVMVTWSGPCNSASKPARRRARTHWAPETGGPHPEPDVPMSHDCHVWRLSTWHPSGPHPLSTDVLAFICPCSAASVPARPARQSHTDVYSGRLMRGGGLPNARRDRARDAVRAHRSKYRFLADVRSGARYTFARR